MKHIQIYTDGACSGKTLNGGWGAVIIEKTHIKELNKGYSHTTNNRMELRAVIGALTSLKEKCEIEIFSDSKYLIQAFKENWIGKWLNNKWKNSQKEDVKNKDLWLELIDLNKKHHITWNWVKGHANNKWNERADELARHASLSHDLIEDKHTPTKISLAEKYSMQHGKINYIEFQVKDKEETKKFFSQLFNWTFTDYSEGYTAFHGAGIEGGFFLSSQKSCTKNGACLIVFYSDNLLKTKQKILLLGGIIIKDIFSFPGGERFQFSDPNGNEFAVWSKK